MDNDSVRSKKSFKRTDSTKAHPWWWDNHMGSKNSKWLDNNLEEMERSVKRMLKLIEEDADSLTKKAELYYQKRPELICLVEEFYRMYRSLANITGELRKSSLSDLQSQSSGVSDISSDEHRIGRSLRSRRAAGFEVFLGTGGNSSDIYQKEGDDSGSVTDSELESDDSSVTNYPGSMSSSCDSQALNRRVIDLEIELREAKEKLKMQNEGNTETLLPKIKRERKYDDLPAKIAAYEQELRDANELIQKSEDEINRLKDQLNGFMPSEMTNGTHSEEGTQSPEEGEPSQDPDAKIQTLAKELRVTRVRLQDAEKKNADLKKELDKSKSADQKLKSLQNQLESAQKEAAVCRNKSSADKREVVKLQERISMLKSSLVSRDHEIRDLKMAVSDAEEKIFPEKAQIKAEISKLLEERDHHNEQIKELESCVRCLEDEIRRISHENKEAEEKLIAEIEELNLEIKTKESCIESLRKRISEMESEKEELSQRTGWLEREVSSRGDRIDEMEKEVEKQRRQIEEGAEEKREVIRQLCFSLDHYRDEYMRFLRAFAGHPPKALPIFTS